LKFPNTVILWLSPNTMLRPLRHHIMVLRPTLALHHMAHLHIAAPLQMHHQSMLPRDITALLSTALPMNLQSMAHHVVHPRDIVARRGVFLARNMARSLASTLERGPIIAPAGGIPTISITLPI